MSKKTNHGTGWLLRLFGSRKTGSGRNGRMERRSADRVKDNSRLVVSGVGRDGKAFREISSVRDVSPGGIAFVLRTNIEPGVLVDLSISCGRGTEPDYLPDFHTQARVLRVSCDFNGSDLFVVAARFEGDVVKTAADDGFEAMVRQLQRAVEYDESRRHQFE